MGKIKIVNYLGDVMYAKKFEMYSVIYANDGYDYIVVQQNHYKVWKKYPTYDPIYQQELYIDPNYIKKLENENNFEKNDIKVPKTKIKASKKEYIQPHKAQKEDIQDKDLEVPKKKRKPRFKVRTPDIQVLIAVPSKIQTQYNQDGYSKDQALIEQPIKTQKPEVQDQSLDVPKRKRKPRFKAQKLDIPVFIETHSRI